MSVSSSTGSRTKGCKMVVVVVRKSVLVLFKMSTHYSFYFDVLCSNSKYRQVVTVISQKKGESPLHVDGSIVFTRFCQCAPRPWTHLSQQPKRHHSWLSHVCTAHGRVFILYSELPLLTLKIAHFHGDLDPI